MEVFAPLVGVTFRGADAKEIVKHLTREDGNKLTLECEPKNPYDDHAVKVIFDPTGEHIGYIAKENNWDVFYALENGEELCIEIVGFENTLKPTLLITTVDSDSLSVPAYDPHPQED